MNQRSITGFVQGRKSKIGKLLRSFHSDSFIFQSYMIEIFDVWASCMCSTVQYSKNRWNRMNYPHPAFSRGKTERNYICSRHSKLPRNEARLNLSLPGGRRIQTQLQNGRSMSRGETYPYTRLLTGPCPRGYGAERMADSASLWLNGLGTGGAGVRSLRTELEARTRVRSRS